MLYVSTRGGAEPVNFADAALAGLAPDGGLFVPETYPQIGPIPRGTPYAEAAGRVLAAFAAGVFTTEEATALARRAYGRFAHKTVAPLTQTGPARFLMELFHGPTLAFKDVAMQLIGEIYDTLLARRGQRLTVVCATSGDTGGAAAAAFAGRENIDLVILHPHERISPVQRLFMTTTGAANVTNLAIEDDFDAAQAMVKAMFADRAFAEEVGLSGVNSINWARIAAQAVYYATAQATLGWETPIRFIVPTGNFGDALAGHVAAQCGMVNGVNMVGAVNANRTLADVFAAGVLKKLQAVATPSPAMDIALPSNIERLLFDAGGRDADALRALYASFAQSGDTGLPPAMRAGLAASGISALSVSDAETEEEMRRTEAETGWLVCPHTAVALHATRQAPTPEGGVDVVLSTASPAKFPETVKAVTGRDAPLPDRCGELLARGEAFDVIPADLSLVRERVRRAAKEGAGA